MKYFNYCIVKAWCLGLFFLAFLFCYASFYPGATSWDSLDQLRQARLNSYLDWQPPLMAYFWHLLLFLQDSTAPMLLFHMAMLWGGALVFFLWSYRERHLLSYGFLLIPIFPWVLNFQFVIWKDTGMAYSWFLAIALGVYWAGRKVPLLVASSMLLLFLYGFLIRSNSITAAIVLLPFLVTLFYNKCSWKILFLSAGGAVVLFVAMPKLVNSALDAESTHPLSYVLFDDLVALKIQDDSFNTNLLTTKNILDFTTCPYLIQTGAGAAFCQNSKFEEVRKTQFAELKTEWFSIVSDNFPYYLLNRFNSFSFLLRSPMQSPHYSKEFTVLEAPQLFSSAQEKPNSARVLVMNFVSSTEKLAEFLFKPYFWAGILIIVMLLLWRHRATCTTQFWMLPLSGITYMLGYYPVTPAPDFRYVYWSILICSVSLIIYVNIRLISQGCNKHPMGIR